MSIVTLTAAAQSLNDTRHLSATPLTSRSPAVDVIIVDDSETSRIQTKKSEDKSAFNDLELHSVHSVAYSTSLTIY